jgi:PAS domain S-box-containing protein
VEIEQRLSTYTALLRSGAGLFAGSDQVTRRDFRNFVAQLRLREHYPGIQGFGYTIRLQPDQVPGLIAEMRRQGLPTFNIRPQTPRSEYHAIVYLEPMDRRNQAALGYDMFTEATRRVAMERARDTGQPAASGRVTLVQEIDPQKQAGFLLYLPIYRSKTIPNTVVERRSQLQGFIYSPFRADDLFEGIFRYQPRRAVNVWVYDGTELRPEFLLRHPHPSLISHAPQFRTVRQVNLAGRTWSLIISSRPSLEQASESRYARYILLVGIFGGLVLSGLIWAQIRARYLIEKTAIQLHQSEVRFRTLVEQSSLSIQILAPDGYPIQVNRAWEDLWGLTFDRLNHYNILQDEQLTELGVMPYIKQAFAGRATAVPPVLYDPQQSLSHTATGIPRWVQAYIYPVKDETGQIREVVLLHEDITERELAEQALKQSNERLGLLYAMSSSLLLHDQPTAFMSSLFSQLSNHLNLEVYFNYLIDRESQQLLLNTYSGIPASVAETISLLKIEDTICGVVAQTAKPCIIEQAQQSSDPKTRLLRSLNLTAYTCYPLLAGEQVIGTISFGTCQRSHFREDELALLQVVADQIATALERAHLMQALQQHTEELVQANRMKDEFLAVLSHELRTPLNAIVGWTQLLRTRQFDAPTTARALETIDRNTQSLVRLIEDLLDVSRIITGKLQLHLTEVNLATIVAIVTEMVQHDVEEKRITITSQLDTSINLKGDANRLQQIVWNLLSNAIKFTPAGGTVWVDLHQIEPSLSPEGKSQTGKFAQLSVSDTGRGIQADFIPYVFDRFRQADSSTTRHYGGLGLGLAIVRHLVELHGGTIQVKSEGENQGATFIATFPLPMTISSYIVLPSEQSILQPQTLKGIEIVILDDEADARELITTVLTQVGATVTATESVKQALDVVQRLQPDVVISDIGMPEADGYDLIRSLNTLAKDQGRQIPVIALTAYAGESNRQQALAAGFQYHLTKPINPTALVQAILECIQPKS